MKLDSLCHVLTRRLSVALVIALVLTSSMFAQEQASTQALTLPQVNIPDNPPYPASVVTTGGQRLLLNHTDAKVRWDQNSNQLQTNKPGWWLINYPLDRIEGLEGRSDDEIASLIFQKPASEIRNWYLKLPVAAGQSPVEPQVKLEPAPIDLVFNATLFVDQHHPHASDENPGTESLPFQTLEAAIKHAGQGDVINVMPGIYRESIKITQNGTRDQPLVIQGIRDRQGKMPVITGNDPVPANMWESVDGLKGVYRAPIVTGQMGPMSVDGEPLCEASWPGQLKPGEFCFNRASRQLLEVKLTNRMPVLNGSEVWKDVQTDQQGFLDLGSDAGHCVILASTWVWGAPKAGKKAVTWDPRFPEPITGKVKTDGEFRLFRMTGSSMNSQVNKYRLWVNDQPIPSAFVPGKPRPTSDYGTSGTIDQLQLREGWNHLVFAFDTTTRPNQTRYRFAAPKGVDAMVSRANMPNDLHQAPQAEASSYITHWQISQPVVATPDIAVYVRLANDENPVDHLVDMAKRKLLVELVGNYVQFRGFELRQGAQFQQRAQLNVQGMGSKVEGNLFIKPEVRAISVILSGKTQTDPPIDVINNVILSPGGLGIGASGDTKQLTSENQNQQVPGRGRLIAQYNIVTDNNRGGYPRFWESGGFKMFRLTGAVLRQNTFIGGDGPAIWLDWEHFNNRIEGNFGIHVTGFLIGVEASPGPNLIANNVAVDIKPGGAWFKYALLAWSSARIWAVHNTLDTGYGAMFVEGPDDRRTAWGKLPERNAALVNSLILGKPTTIHPGLMVPIRGNRLYGEYQNFGVHRWQKWEQPEIAEHVLGSTQVAGAVLPKFPMRDIGDFRLTANSPDAEAGQTSVTVHTQEQSVDIVDLVKHDFYGLIRFPGEKRSAGAFRVDPQISDQIILEVQYADQKVERR